MRYLLTLLWLSLIGCHAAPFPEKSTWEEDQAWERPVTKTLLPISLVAAYFATIATHEAGHAVVMDRYGMDSIKIDIFPGSESNGSFHLGLTSAHFNYENRPNSMAQAAIDVSGPGFTFGSQIWARELLKTGYVPDVLQPSLQWYGVFSKGSFYGELLLGFARVRNADFGKQPIWVSCLFTGLGLTYDIWDFFFCDSPERYFKVLIGEAFYQPKKDSIFNFWVGSANGGGLATVGIKF